MHHISNSMDGTSQISLALLFGELLDNLCNAQLETGSCPVMPDVAVNAEQVGLLRLDSVASMRVAGYRDAHHDEQQNHSANSPHHLFDPRPRDGRSEWRTAQRSAAANAITNYVVVLNSAVATRTHSVATPPKSAGGAESVASQTTHFAFDVTRCTRNA